LSMLVVYLVDGADVRVIQGRRGLRLTLEAGQSLRILGNIVREELQSDKTVELYVLGLVHHTHPAAAEFFDDAIVRNGLADHLQSNAMAEKSASQ
jgi:hypothetical protein